MGRRFKGYVPQEMLEDPGLPGKLYFEQPSVVDIMVRRSPDGTKVMTMDASSRVSSVRLASTVVIRDFNQKEPVEYFMSIRPDLGEIKEYLKKAEVGGFGLGSIVARRWCADWRWETCQQWGLIVGVRNYTANTFADELYSPFTVRWLDKTTPEEGCWAEDLYVIHTCMGKGMLTEIVEAQQEDSEDGSP